MSQENVEIVRRGYDAFNRGDIEGVIETAGFRGPLGHVGARVQPCRI